MTSVDGTTGPQPAIPAGATSQPAAPPGEETAPAEPAAAPGGRWLRWRKLASASGDWGHGSRRAASVIGRHWLVSALLVTGLVLRVLAQIAYRPALLYVDTLKYLYGAYPGSDPLGYRYLLKVILVAGDLGLVAAIQHLLGLAMAVVLYIVLMRRGVNRWLASLAVAPVLLDAYQLQMEQTIMPDVWFEAIIVAGLAVLLWKPATSPRAAAVAGLILGASATFRQVGELLILPAVLYLLVTGGGWRRALIRS
ncbi:MAG TPA: hypothetical protein VGS62_11355, partial [Streptosporangiaceae bacterium]|nr:hypothetical protein [Streptosporangiaceae bacterium]